MSLLVNYSLKSPGHHESQKIAMTDLVEGLKSENITGLHYSCFSTDSPLHFIGVLEFEDDAAKQSFLSSAAFATYREKVGPTFANPPKTTEIVPIATTRD